MFIAKIIQEVFKTIGMIVITLLLFSLFFGGIGRTFMWNGIERPLQNHWKMITMNDGSDISEAIGTVFDESVEYNRR